REGSTASSIRRCVIKGKPASRRCCRTRCNRSPRAGSIVSNGRPVRTRRSPACPSSPSKQPRPLKVQTETPEGPRALSPRRKVGGQNGMERRAEPQIEPLGVELSVDRLGLVLARARTLRVRPRRADALDHVSENVLQTLPV